MLFVDQSIATLREQLIVLTWIGTTLVQSKPLSFSDWKSRLHDRFGSQHRPALSRQHHCATNPDIR